MLKFWKDGRLQQSFILLKNHSVNFLLSGRFTALATLVLYSSYCNMYGYTVREILVIK
jgi:hypothetical protein